MNLYKDIQNNLKNHHSFEPQIPVNTQPILPDADVVEEKTVDNETNLGIIKDLPLEQAIPAEIIQQYSIPTTVEENPDSPDQIPTENSLFSEDSSFSAFSFISEDENQTQEPQQTSGFGFISVKIIAKKQ